MNIQYIDKQLSIIENAMEWSRNVPVSEQLDYRKKLINMRRELKKIRYAVSEPCSTAAFGESQMGKSYLVSAMLSTPSHPFSVTDGNKQYDFISKINPSNPNSTIEATGVITRFTTHADDNIPTGFLKVHLLSITDIILILCEAYYNQVDYARESILTKEMLNEYIDNIVPEKPSSPVTYLCDDDILDLKEYIIRSSILQKKCNHIIESDFFNYFILHLKELSEDQLSRLVQLLWNQDEYIGKLWDDMHAAYKKLRYEQKVYARFDAVLKKKGTLLDVARLDEMYGEPEDYGNEYEPFAEIKLSSDGTSIKIEKSFFSSLIAELSFTLSKELTSSHLFLNDLDILDFPGARRPEQIKQSKLGEGKNLSTVLRRGKVSYLFNKYSAAKRISTLLFCHNNNQSAESSMGGLLDKWVYGNIGVDAREREKYVKASSIAPLFIIGTWFNKDLEYHDGNDRPDDIDNLKARWNRRFVVVLEKEVLRSLDDESHWFNCWSSSKKPFQNIYMLRDFKYSKMIYGGYNPEKGTPESGEVIKPNNYPSFFEDLKKSFVNHDFVKLHFDSPIEAWNASATCAMDGTKRIINGLNTIAPNVSHAREDKFNADIQKVVNDFLLLLEKYYHPDSSDEKLMFAKRQSGTACFQIDKMIGRDPYSFGRMMDAMMISESEVYELVHALLLGEEQPMPMSDEERQIFMSAGLDSSSSREDNIGRLCNYLGVFTEEECVAALDDIDLEKLLSQNQMMTGKADHVVAAVESLWHEKVLMNRSVRLFEEILPAASTIVSSLWGLYNMLDVRNVFIQKIRDYIHNIDKETSIGIISDYLSMQLNEFTSTFGYSFYNESQKKRISDKNKELKLHLDESLLNPDKTVLGIGLLSDLYQQKELLTGSSFVSKDRAFLARFPQYMRVWRWEHQLRAGFIFASELPDYDIKANAELKGIIENVRN